MSHHLASAVYLISLYKPVLILATFMPWAWLVSSKLEKDAIPLRLNVNAFNIAYMACGVGALAVMLFVPIFWIGWPMGIVVLAAPVYVYVQVRNRAVPEKNRFTLSGKALTAKLTTGRAVKHTEASLRFVDAKGGEHKAPRKDDPRHAVHMGVEDLIMPSLEARVSRLELAVGPRGAAVTQMIDGVRYKREAPPPETAVPMIDYLKEIAGLNVEDRRRRQTGEVRVRGPIDAEVALVTAGSSSGQELRIVFNPAKQVLKPIDGIGLLPSQLEAIRAFEEPHARHGVFLFGAPRGHGLTTTGYALTGRHDAYTSNVKTLEREIEARLDGVDQVRWDPSNPAVDYPSNLQSIIRRDPDVVLLAPLTEPETARIAAEPGMEGPLLYVPQRAASITEQIRDWAKLVGDLKKAMRPLSVVMNQRLLRHVCPNCRQAYQPSADQLRKLNLPAEKIKQLYQAGGKVQVKNKIETCPVCAGSGYFGQIGVFQVMVVGDETRRLLMAGDLKAALAQARRNKMVYLQEAALRQVVDGLTTIEEVVRVTAPSRGPESPQPKPAAAT